MGLNPSVSRGNKEGDDTLDCDFVFLGVDMILTSLRIKYFCGEGVKCWKVRYVDTSNKTTAEIFCGSQVTRKLDMI